MSILGRYLFVSLLRSMFMVLLALLSLFLFFDLIAELGALGRGNYSVLHMMAFVVLRLPGRAYELLPIATLIGGLFSLSLLNQQSEYTVMRVCGLSLWRVVGHLVLAGLLFSVMTFLLGEYVAPGVERSANQMRLAATGQAVAQNFRSGFWAKDGKSFVNVREVLPNNTLRGISIYEFDTQRSLQRITWADHGNWNPDNEWRLSGVTVTWFQAAKVVTATFPQFQWRSVISPETLAVLLVVPEQMSARSLAGYIEHLRKNSQKTRRYEIALWSKLFYPLACIPMLLIALPFAQGQRRSGGIGARLFLGIMLGLGFYFMNRLVGHMGLLYDWPPILSSILPSLAFLLIAGVLLWAQERR